MNFPEGTLLVAKDSDGNHIGGFKVGGIDGLLAIRSDDAKYNTAYLGCTDNGDCSTRRTPTTTSDPAVLARREHSEHDRIYYNTNQPPKVKPFTEIGFEKRKVPESLWKALRGFYDRNKDAKIHEGWPADYAYVNHWEVPTFMVHLPEEWTGSHIKQDIYDAMQPILEQWSGVRLERQAMYGIRVYTRGSVLSSHVDRLQSHVVSAIINVDQDGTAAPWELEIYDHEGKPHIVLMEPGEMVLYESARAQHGRPKPLEGAHYANVFVHFRPLNWHIEL